MLGFASSAKREKRRDRVSSQAMILIIVLTIFSLDQLTKFLISRNLFLNQSSPVIKGIFYLTLIHNRGAAFGILKNQVPLFISVSLFAIILISLNLSRKSGIPPAIKQWAGKNNNKKFYRFSLSLILAGALGNLIDRLFLGYVIDFLDFRIWPVFNIADSAITIGAIFLGYTILRERKA
ncbi:MAG: signal peptidase II [Candidatus Omnitrophica bacterium]|nr:signal peptidase II [Candidatus Omnitrophota bacterium]